MTTTLQIALPKLHRSQATYMNSTRRFNVLCAGRRWGKNVVALHRLAPLALEGYPCGFFSPTYRLLGESWREFCQVLAPAIERRSETEKRLELIGGGSIEFWSMHDDENAGRSRKYKRVVIDEAAMEGNLETVFNSAVRPTLTDLVGDCDLLSTPRGRGFFYRAWCRGQDSEQKDWASFRFPSSDNPFLPPGEIEEAKRQLPDRVFRQEYGAEFLDDAGGVFRKVHDAVDVGRTPEIEAQTCAKQEDIYIPRSRRWRDERWHETESLTYSMGIDLARVHDFTVVTILDSKGKQVYWDRWNQVSWERQITGIIDVAARFKPYVYVDQTGIGDAIFERLQRTVDGVFPYHFSNASKIQLMDNLGSLIENGGIRLMDIPVQTGELVNYEYRMTAARNVQMTAPEGEYDDCVCALALAAWGIGPHGCYSSD